MAHCRLIFRRCHEFSVAFVQHAAVQCSRKYLSFSPQPQNPHLSPAYAPTPAALSLCRTSLPVLRFVSTAFSPAQIASVLWYYGGCDPGIPLYLPVGAEVVDLVVASPFVISKASGRKEARRKRGRGAASFFLSFVGLLWNRIIAPDPVASAYLSWDFRWGATPCSSRRGGKEQAPQIRSRFRVTLMFSLDEVCPAWRGRTSGLWSPVWSEEALPCSVAAQPPASFTSSHPLRLSSRQRRRLHRSPWNTLTSPLKRRSSRRLSARPRRRCHHRSKHVREFVNVEKSDEADVVRGYDCGAFITRFAPFWGATHPISKILCVVAERVLCLPGNSWYQFDISTRLFLFQVGHLVLSVLVGMVA